MTISAKVIADSKWQDVRITTLQLRYPRFIHAEFMTHRMFSRNASSSRAIPIERLIADIENDPVKPSYWGKNQKGMQASEEIGNKEKYQAEHVWDTVCWNAVVAAQELAELKVHKQIVNRILEPFSHINVVVTATEWENFFLLRNHPDAQPEMQELARVMKEAMIINDPVDRRWHLPYVDRLYGNELENFEDLAFRLSAARCARVSYRTHEGKPPELEEDVKLYERLTQASPPHLSPLEHAAIFDSGRFGAEWWANFRSWRSFRNYCEQWGF